MPSKPLEEMTPEELSEILVRRFHLEPDEIKVLFPSEQELLNAVRDAIKTATAPVDADTEKDLGWSKTDKTKLTADQKRAVDEHRAMQLEREALKKKLDAKKKKLEAQAKEMEETAQEETIAKQIEATGADLKPSDVKQALSDIEELKRLLRDEDDEVE